MTEDRAARREALKKRLNRVFQEVFDDDSIEIFDAMTADDLDEWDSVEHITLVVATEQAFGITVKAAEVGQLENVGAMLDILLERATR